jgi:hypothetical protein
MSTYHALRGGVFLPPFHRMRPKYEAFSARRKAASARHFAVEEAAKTRDVAK